MKKVAIYVRVSTQEQVDGYSIQEQIERLTKYCEAHGWMLVGSYTDPGYSGANTDRPALQKLFADAKRGCFDTVLVYKLDRLSRSQKDTMYIIEDIFLKSDIDFISMNENFDTSTPFGRAMIGILSVFAQLERDQIKERTAMGQVGRAKSGKWSGSSRPPIGYDYKNGELIINEYEAMQVRLVYDMFLNGYHGKTMTMHAILEHMRKHYTTRYSNWNNESAVGRMLRDPIYIGTITFAGKTYPGIHEPIISKEVFDAVQIKYRNYMETFALAGNRSGYFERQSLLSGIIFCGLCGARYCATSTVHTRKSGIKTRYRYYHCYSRGGKKEMRKADHCTNKRYSVDELNQIVIDEICRLATDSAGFQNLIHQAENPAFNQTETLRKRIAEIDSQTARLLDLYQMGNIDLSVIRSRIEGLNKEKAQLESDIESQETPVPSLDPKDALDILGTAENVFKNGTITEQQDLVRSLIHKIILYPENIEIHWLFCC